MKFFLRFLRDKIFTPFYFVLFTVLPLKTLSHIVCLVENEVEPLKIKVLRHFLGMQHQRAVSIYNMRLVKLPVPERRERAKEVWRSPTTDSWGQRAFIKPEERCSAYAYQAIQEISLELKKPLRILDLGCNNASSYHCLIFLGIEVEYYCGIDINERMIEEAKQRYNGQAGVRFRSMDFLNHLKDESETYDILLDKEVFLFLDQDYLEDILNLVSEKRLADRIVFQERILENHADSDSKIMNMSVTPVNYSHNYNFLLEKFGFNLESDSKKPIPSVENISQYLAVAKFSTDG